MCFRGGGSSGRLVTISCKVAGGLGTFAIVDFFVTRDDEAGERR